MCHSFPEIALKDHPEIAIKKHIKIIMKFPMKFNMNSLLFTGCNILSDYCSSWIIVTILPRTDEIFFIWW